MNEQEQDQPLRIALLTTAFEGRVDIATADHGRYVAYRVTRDDAKQIMAALESVGQLNCSEEGHVCANYTIHAQAKIIRQRMEIASLKEQVRIATDQLQAFSDQGKERYPGEMGTFAHDALIQMSVVE